MPITWPTDVGINHTPAYQVSGRPFASASVIYDNTVRTVEFPYVTRWVQVINKGESTVRMGFSAAGITGAGTDPDALDAYYIVLDPSGSTGYYKSDIYEMKISTLYFKNDGGTNGTVDVIAGLTTIPRQRAVSNFTGSTGV